MTIIEEIAEAVLEGDGLLARSLVQDFVRDQPVLVDISTTANDKSPLVSNDGFTSRTVRATDGPTSSNLDGSYWSNGYTCVFGAGGAKNETVA